MLLAVVDVVAVEDVGDVVVVARVGDVVDVGGVGAKNKLCEHNSINKYPKLSCEL